MSCVTVLAAVTESVVALYCFGPETVDVVSVVAPSLPSPPKEPPGAANSSALAPELARTNLEPLPEIAKRVIAVPEEKYAKSPAAAADKSAPVPPAAVGMSATYSGAVAPELARINLEPLPEIVKRVMAVPLEK